MALDKNRIRAICFDIDGTMSDTDDRVVQRILPIISPVKKMIRNLETERIARRIVMGIETPGNWVYSLPDILGIDDELAWVGDKLARFNRKPPSFLLIPGIERLLKHLHPLYPLSVVSARDQYGSLTFLEQFQINSFFQHIITAQTCQHTKPFPDPLLFAAEKMGVKPSELLMVGDTTVDIVSARKAGAQSVGVLCGFGEEKELVKAGANLIVQTTSDLIQVLG